MTGLEERVFGRLPDATWVYPGHGNDTTLGAERAPAGVARPRLVSLTMTDRSVEWHLAQAQGRVA
jgi:glyoxylase-like metal-dependent hydrolase (beta-lactamase superfamily II)